MKKLLTLALALVMILSLATTAFAADVTVTIKDNTAYGSGDTPITFSYNAYKLMTASVSASETEYSYVVNPAYESALENVLGLPDTADSKAIVDAVEAIATAEAMHHFANELYREILDQEISADESWTGATNTMEQAYWLIVDVTDLDGEKYSNSLVMVDTVGNSNITINNKPASTTSEKKIDDENDSLVYPSPESEDATSWQEVADYDIGDEVPYDINVYMANDIAEYTYYSIVMQDSVEQGLTYLPLTFEILVNGVKADIAEKSVATADDEFVYEIETDVDSLGVQTAQRLYVYPNYNYTKNDGTPVTANKDDGGDFLAMFPTGTPHSQINGAVIKFTYKCLLNENAVTGVAGNPNDYTLKFSNNPYSDSFGETPEDTAIVLTYKVIVNKTDAAGNALTGAKFTLYKFYAKANETMPEAEALAKGYVHHDAANAWGKFEEVSTVEVDAAGTVFGFDGLDDGYYKLEETEAPLGYNKIEPIEFQIQANHVKEIGSGAVLDSLSGTTLIGSELTFEADTAKGTLTTDVENHAGSELPSTGGMGTTLFYAFGGFMVAAAAVLLVTKKRMAV